MTVTSLFDQLIDQYRLEKHIAQKAYTDVYLAYDVDEKHSVHVEILQPRYAEDAQFARKFAERATALSRVRHPNLVRVYQSGTAVDDRPYVATEVVKGYPLSERLSQLARQKSPVHSVYALKLVRQIAEAVQFGERLDLYHYALAPDNVLLKSVTLRSDDAVIVDNLFIPPQNGYVDADSRPYLSPEQLDGKELSGRSMVYSLGAMLHHLLTGAPPAGPVGWWEQASTTFSGRSRLQSIRNDLSPELYALVDRSLRANPATRYRGVSEFITAVDEAITAEELRIHTDEVAAIPRRPWPLLLAVIAVILLCMLGIWGLWRAMPGAGSSGAAVAAGGMLAATETAAMLETEPTATHTPAATNTPAPTSDTATGAGGGMAQVTEPPTATPTFTPAPTETPSPTATATVEPSATPTAVPQFRITVASAALREGPSTLFPSASFLYEGDVVTILGRNDGETLWYVVLTQNNQLGWLSDTVGERINATTDISVAATVPVPPTRTPTPTPTKTPLPTETPLPPPGGGNNGGGNDGGGNKPTPVRPTPTPPI